VQAAFDNVLPGGTVQFAEGTYVLGEGARVTVPDVTVSGWGSSSWRTARRRGHDPCP